MVKKSVIKKIKRGYSAFPKTANPAIGTINHKKRRIFSFKNDFATKNEDKERRRRGQVR